MADLETLTSITRNARRTAFLSNFYLLLSKSSCSHNHHSYEKTAMTNNIANNDANTVFKLIVAAIL